MKINELVKHLNELGQVGAEVRIDKCIVVSDGHGYCRLFIPIAATNWLEVRREKNLTNSFSKMKREYISALISEFLETPVDERFPEKKVSFAMD